jgi:hypothetical protein
VQLVTMNTASVFVTTNDSIVRISKKDCSSTTTAIASASSIAATDDTLYVVHPTSDGQCKTLSALPANGAGPGVDIDLSGVFDGPICTIGAVTADALSVHVIVSHTVGDGGAPTEEMAVVEVPCCGGSPRVVAELPRSVDIGWLPRFETRGSTLVLSMEKDILDAGPVSSLFTIDAASGNIATLFDARPTRQQLFGEAGGNAYVAAGTGISVVNVANGCGTSDFVNAIPGTVSALFAQDDFVYWGEEYPGLVESGLYRRAPLTTGPPEKLARNDGVIESIWTDDAFVYWTSAPPSEPVDAVYRERLP